MSNTSTKGQAMTTDRLLPCPFCGCPEPHLVTNTHAGMSWVACIVCGLEAPSETGVSAEDAVRYWNERASPPSPAPSESGAVAESSRQIIHELAADIRDRLSREEGSANWRNAQRIVELSRPVAPSASMGRVTDAMVEAGCRALARMEVSPTLDAQIERIEKTWPRYRHEALAVLAAIDSPPDHGGGEGWVLVPREPTIEMIDAGDDPQFGNGPDIVRHIYRAMLAALLRSQP